jgi:hypothetical protein
MSDRPQKITFAEMREMEVRGLMRGEGVGGTQGLGPRLRHKRGLHTLTHHRAKTAIDRTPPNQVHPQLFGEEVWKRMQGVDDIRWCNDARQQAANLLLAWITQREARAVV